MEFLLVIGAIVVLYLIVNGKRNSDPLNRKCAAEICDFLVDNVGNEECTPENIAEIFTNNARYYKQAGHIVSMIPPLLMQAGISKSSALSIVPLLRSAQELIPR